MAAQTGIRDRLSTKVSTNPAVLSQYCPTNVPETKHTSVDTISNNQSSKEKKTLVIKRKKTTDNQIPDAAETYEKRPKNSCFAPTVMNYVKMMPKWHFKQLQDLSSVK